jgi:hypothetical protein
VVLNWFWSVLVPEHFSAKVYSAARRAVSSFCIFPFHAERSLICRANQSYGRRYHDDLLLHQPAIEQAAEYATRDWREPKQPELLDSPSARE